MADDSFFGRFAKKTATICGKPWTFVSAVTLVLVWGASGPLFGFSETWQLVINTSTTIITFLMVFIIQNTQNKDTAALQIKLDELIRVNKHAHNALMGIEEFSDEELEKLRTYFCRLATEAHRAIDEGRKDSNKPESDTALTELLKNP